MPISISQCVLPPCQNSLILFVPFVRYVIRRQAVIYLLVRFFFLVYFYLYFVCVRCCSCSARLRVLSVKKKNGIWFLEILIIVKVFPKKKREFFNSFLRSSIFIFIQKRKRTRNGQQNRSRKRRCRPF